AATAERRPATCQAVNVTALIAAAPVENSTADPSTRSFAPPGVIRPLLPGSPWRGILAAGRSSRGHPVGHRGGIPRYSSPCYPRFMKIGVSLPDHLLVFADEEAERRGITRSGLLARLLEAE